MFNDQNGITSPTLKTRVSGLSQKEANRRIPAVARRQIRGKSDEEILAIIEAEIADRKQEAKLVRKDIRRAERARRAAEKAAQLKEIEQLIAGHDPELIKGIIRDGLSQL